MVFEIYDIEYFIKDIEIENLDEYCVLTKHYNSILSYKEFDQSYEKVTVHFTDGTKQTIEHYCDNDNETNNTVTLPNGKKCTVYTYVAESEDNESLFVAGIGSKHFIEKKCEIVTAPLSDEIAYFMSYIGYRIEKIPEDIRLNIEDMASANSAAVAAESFRQIFSDTFEHISWIFKNISMFISYVTL